MDFKTWFTSKTIWVNVAGVVAAWICKLAGVELTPEITLTILGVINLVLRIITKSPIVWSK